MFRSSISSLFDEAPPRRILFSARCSVLIGRCRGEAGCPNARENGELRFDAGQINEHELAYSLMTIIADCIKSVISLYNGCRIHDGKASRDTDISGIKPGRAQTPVADRGPHEVANLKQSVPFLYKAILTSIERSGGVH